MKRFYMVLLALLVAFIAPNVYALPVAQADNTLTINENYDDNAFFAGNIVDVNSKIDGMGFAAGNTVNVKGSSDYGFAAGNSVTVTDYESKDLFVAGSNVTVSNSTVRSIYAAGAVVTIKNNARTIYVAGENITLEGEYENVYVEADEFNFKGTITGTLTINEEAKTTIATDATINKKETYKSENVNIDKADIGKAFVVAKIMAKIMAKILHMINILIIGLLAILLFKKTTAKVADMKVDAGFVFANFGFGLLALIAIPVISIILLFTGIVSGLAVVSLVLYGLAIYLSEIVGTLYIAKKLFTKMNTYLAFMLTLLIVSAISLVPILGGLFSFFMLCMSLGLIINLVSSEIKGK